MAFTFKDIIAWQKAYDFILQTYKITRSFPDYEKYGLASQFQRAAVSIAGNIAEGYKRLSKSEKLHFMNYAQGSLEECRCYVMLSKDLNYITEEEYNS
jgi:four helix bundle protein